MPKILYSFSFAASSSNLFVQAVWQELLRLRDTHTHKTLSLAYCRNYRIDSNQMLQNDKDHQILFAGDLNAYDKSKMADGRHLEKVDKSRYLSSGVTDRHEIWHDDANWALHLQTTQFRIIKSKMSDSRHLKNRHKLPYFCNVLNHCQEMCQDDALWSSASR